MEESGNNMANPSTNMLDIGGKLSQHQLRTILNQVLGLRCIFPCFSEVSAGTDARCMLEQTSQCNPDALMMEDIFCKVIEKVDNANNDESSFTQKVNHEVIYHFTILRILPIC